ncbi:MAG: xanthine dehydrogenase small subunit [Paracoccaceae bacterium]|jgi:xanthine dehydrogenase small subunit
MNKISFLLNGTPVSIGNVSATQTVLDYLRETQALCGTKEGCNEGDCGACTVMVTDALGRVRALNACLLFLPQIDSCAVRTVEGLADPGGAPHPVQTAMVTHHGSQCGFCTPGFVVSMAVAHASGARDHDKILAGNLCRCTGYAPIIRAAKAAEVAPVPEQMRMDKKLLLDLPASDHNTNDALKSYFHPKTSDSFAAWYLENPAATLIAGATDVGLWVTKGMRDLPKIAFLGQIKDLQTIIHGLDDITVGAGVTIADLKDVLEDIHPSFATLLSRYGSNQVRHAATIGGNIANGSPIGDAPPVLIALGATLHLRQGDTRRAMPVEDYFLAYGRQDRLAGEFVEKVTLPRKAENLRCYKISKRRDQDISAVCGAFNITVDAKGLITTARIAFGGMSGTPQRATALENQLLGREWSENLVKTASPALEDDFSPLSDLRASSYYRRAVARNLLQRYFNDLIGKSVDISEVAL